MSLSDDQREFVRETINVCRTEVDRELHALRAQLATHTLTEDQAEAIAVRAAQHAKVMTKKELVDDVKIEIANSAIEILRRSFQVVVMFIVGLAFYIGTKKWPWD